MPHKNLQIEYYGLEKCLTKQCKNKSSVYITVNMY